MCRQRNYATENCVINAYRLSIHNVRDFWGQNFYRHSANLILFMTFYVFWNVTSKKRKNSCIFEIWKKTKNTYSRTLASFCAALKTYFFSQIFWQWQHTSHWLYSLTCSWSAVRLHNANRVIWSFCRWCTYHFLTPFNQFFPRHLC